MRMVQPCVDRGHHIYFDNYYTLPAVLKDLSSKGFGVCDILRVNRKDVSPTDHLSLSTTIFYRCQQTVQLPPVLKPIQLKQTISPKTALTVPTNISKDIIYQIMYLCCILFAVLCIVCCVSQYCIVPTIKCKIFQQNFIFFS